MSIFATTPKHLSPPYSHSNWLPRYIFSSFKNLAVYPFRSWYSRFTYFPKSAFSFSTFGIPSTYNSLISLINFFLNSSNWPLSKLNVFLPIIQSRKQLFHIRSSLFFHEILTYHILNANFNQIIHVIISICSIGITQLTIVW